MPTPLDARAGLVALGLAVAGAWLALSRPIDSQAQNPAATPAEPLEQRFTATVRPFVERYCIGCHGPKKQSAMLDLSRETSVAAVVKNIRHWELVLERLHANEMPPEDATKQPAAEERAA